jgi:hypothetical protein
MKKMHPQINKYINVHHYIYCTKEKIVWAEVMPKRSYPFDLLFALLQHEMGDANLDAGCVNGVLL